MFLPVRAEPVEAQVAFRQAQYPQGHKGERIFIHHRPDQ